MDHFKKFTEKIKGYRVKHYLVIFFLLLFLTTTKSQHLRFEKTPFTEVCKFLKTSFNVNITVKPSLEKRLKSTKITLSLNKVKLNAILKLLSRFYGFHYKTDKNIITLTDNIAEISNIQLKILPIDKDDHLKELIPLLQQSIPEKYHKVTKINSLGNKLMIASTKISQELIAKNLTQLKQKQSLDFKIIFRQPQDLSRLANSPVLTQANISLKRVGQTSWKENEKTFSIKLKTTVVSPLLIMATIDIVVNKEQELLHCQTSALLEAGKSNLVYSSVFMGKPLAITITPSLPAIAPKKTQQVYINLLQEATTLKLDQLISLDFTEAPLAEVTNFLQQITNINIVIDPAIQAKNIKISLSVNKLSIAKTLPLLLHPKNLDYVIEDNIVIVALKEHMQNTVRKIYPIADILSFYKSSKVKDLLTFFLGTPPSSLQVYKHYRCLWANISPQQHQKLQKALYKIRKIIRGNNHLTLQWQHGNISGKSFLMNSANSPIKIRHIDTQVEIYFLINFYHRQGIISQQKNGSLNYQGNDFLIQGQFQARFKKNKVLLKFPLKQVYCNNDYGQKIDNWQCKITPLKRQQFVVPMAKTASKEIPKDLLLNALQSNDEKLIDAAIFIVSAKKKYPQAQKLVQKILEQRRKKKEKEKENEEEEEEDVWDEEEDEEDDWR